MTSLIKSLYLGFLLFAGWLNLSAQNIQDTAKLDAPSTLQEDTLFIGSAIKLYVGESLKIGEGTAENNWYRTIGFKSFLNFPLLFLQDFETKNNSDYRLNPQHRTNDKVKESLVPGESLIITKIKREGKRRQGYWYTATLKNKRFLGLQYYCNIVNALKTKELLIKE